MLSENLIGIWSMKIFLYLYPYPPKLYPISLKYQNNNLEFNKQTKYFKLIFLLLNKNPVASI